MFNIPKASHRATVIFTCFESQDHQGERDRWWWPWEAQISAALTPPVLHHPSSSTQQNSLTAGPVPTSHLSALGPSPSWRWLLSDILPLQLDDVMTEYDGIAALFSLYPHLPGDNGKQLFLHQLSREHNYMLGLGQSCSRWLYGTWLFFLILFGKSLALPHELNKCNLRTDLVLLLVSTSIDLTWKQLTPFVLTKLQKGVLFKDRIFHFCCLGR